MKTSIILLCLFVLFFQNLAAQAKPWQGPAVDFSKGKLKISENKRYLIHEDGTPFFYLGDTVWELLHRLDKEETEKFLENRRTKGFTVIQAVILAELDGLNTPNAEGNKPLQNNDPTKPGEAYFEHVDWVIKKAKEKGLYMGLLPTWGDKVDKAGWGVGPEIFNADNAYKYGQWLGKRYKDYENIIWINGGDRDGGGKNNPIWEAMGRGIKSEDKNHLMSFHPWGGHSSSEWFHNSDWLDFNMMQTGHCERTSQTYKMISKDYNLKPTKPCMDAEPRYEDHPICWSPDSLGWFNELHVRQAAYWNLFTGGHGHTYGCHPIWQMLAPGREPIGHARHNWYDVIDLVGAFDMTHVRRLMESRPMLSRVPCQEIVLDAGDVYNRIQATKGDGYVFVYTAMGKDIVLDLSEIGIEKYKVWWFNPRTGGAIEKGEVKRGRDLRFSPPAEGPGFDWVLVLDDTGKKYPAPGSVNANM
jgi:hypothetical protein